MKILSVYKNKINSAVSLVRTNGVDVVIKYYKKYIYPMFIEINVMATSLHTNIATFEKIFVLNQTNQIAIQMPKYEKSFVSTITNSEIQIEQKLTYFLQILNGVRYLHHNNVAHLDLKPDNICIDNQQCKIIDFGNATYLFAKNQFGIGTVTHRAPESYFYKENDFTKMDIWSLGIIIFEIYSKCEMHNHPDIQLIGKLYGYNQKLYDQAFYSYIMSDKFQKIILQTVPPEFCQMLSTDPKLRPKIDEIFKMVSKKANATFIDPNLNLKIDTKFDKKIFPDLDLRLDLDLDQIFDKLVLNNTPVHIIYSIIDLYHRTRDRPDIESNIDQILELGDIFNKGFSDKININKINSILLRTNGIIYQFHMYLTSGPIQTEKFILCSNNYLHRSRQIVELVKID